MNEEKNTHGFSEHHHRHARTTFQYIDKLLSEAEHIMSDAGSPKLRTSGPGYVECRLRPIGFSSATRTPARIRIAPKMPLGGNLSPITTKEKKLIRMIIKIITKMKKINLHMLFERDIILKSLKCVGKNVLFQNIRVNLFFINRKQKSFSCLKMFKINII